MNPLPPLLTALGLFTRLPLPARAFATPWQAGLLAWLPPIGVLIGLLAAGATWLGAQCFNPLLAGVVGTGVWIAITGGLHLDGVADCGDGLACCATREKRLEIMRDPRLGAFGAVALLLAVLLKIAALAMLAEMPWPTLFAACALAALLGRTNLALAVLSQPVARPSGMGASFKRVAQKWEGALALLLAGVACACLGWHGLAAAVGATAAFLWLTGLARSRLGGMTGDVYGALIELTEIAALLAFCGRRPW